ncbi:MAG TPA: aldehyde dehydrogenase family protein [Steroidobacteraceae bacterium]|jgi:aldehyde dehydrogenase (NAD+)|nr:aldehyde dehydrogenase family protein [Steroidobacteraceae bacterium]
MANTDAARLLSHFQLLSQVQLPSSPTAAAGDATSGGALAAGAYIDSFSPGDGTLIGRVAATSPADLDAVMDRAVAASHRWADLPAPQRAEVVRLIGAALRTHKRELGELIALENGKIIGEALGEVQEMIDVADFAVGQSRMLYGRTMHSERPQHRMYEQWHPLGVVGIITAFNFPVAVWAWNALLAVVCGNACVWKPSPRTPLCALAVQRLCEQVLEALQAPPVFQLVLDGGTAVARALIDDRRAALISFTGSTAVGRQVAQAVASRLGKSLLELGGNGAIIVDESADLALATRAIVFGALGTAGQRCTTTRRVLVARARLPELQRRLVAAYRQIRIGDPRDPATLMGPLIDPNAVRNYQSALAAAQAAGGELLVGGRVLERPGNYVEPAIVLARNDWQIVQRETFAPILYLIAFDTLEEAIELQNRSAYGLSSGLFTQRLATAELYLSHRGSDCGIANINLGTSGAEIGGAFGGEKDTGGGRESGSDAWKAYMRRQTNTINWGAALPLAQGIEFDVAPQAP